MVNRIVYSTEDILQFFAKLHKVPLENVKMSSTYEEALTVDVPPMEPDPPHPTLRNHV